MRFRRTSLADAWRAFGLSMDVQFAQRDPHYLRSFDTPFQRWIWRNLLGGLMYRFLCEGYTAVDDEGQLIGYAIVNAGRLGLAGVDLLADPRRRRGSRFGAAGMEFMFRLAEQRGLPFIYGTVTRTNKSAMSLYHQPHYGPLCACDASFDLADTATWNSPPVPHLSEGGAKPCSNWRKAAAPVAARELAMGNQQLEKCLVHDVLPILFFWALKGWEFKSRTGALGYIVVERLVDSYILHLYSEEALWGTPEEVLALCIVARDLAKAQPGKTLTVTVGSEAHYDRLMEPMSELGFVPGLFYRKLMFLQVEHWHQHHAEAVKG